MKSTPTTNISYQNLPVKQRQNLQSGSLDMLPMQQPQLAFGKSSSDSRGDSMSSIVIDKAAISLFSTNKDE